MDTIRQVTATFDAKTSYPSYDSNPAPGSEISLGMTSVAGTFSATLTISETGEAALVVTPTLGGADAEEFSIAPSTLTIPDDAAAQDLTISCTPSATRTLAATLTVVHNAPGSPAVYLLNCTGRKWDTVYLPLVVRNDNTR
jgi:hypothetical protein